MLGEHVPVVLESRPESRRVGHRGVEAREVDHSVCHQEEVGDDWRDHVQGT